MEAIQRVCTVQLKNFKGFAGRQKPIDTDAHIVLITGPNGYGKTSFLEALTAILTGYHPYDDPILAFVPAGGNETESEIEITAIVQCGNGEQQKTTFSIGWDRSGLVKVPLPPTGPVTIAREFPRPVDFPPSKMEKPERYELHARLCAFFQERVSFQYDQGVRGNTLGDTIEPIAPEIDWIIHKLQSLTEVIASRMKALREFSSPEPDEAIRQRLEEKSLPFMTFCNEMSQRPGAEWLAGPRSFVRGAEVGEFVRSALRKRGIEEVEIEPSIVAERFERSIGEFMSGWIKEAEARAAGLTEDGRQQQTDLEACEAEIRSIETEYPMLEKEVTLFEPEHKEECDALTLMRTLAANARRWAALELPDRAERDQGRLGEVLEEFGRVDESRAAECRNILDNWFGRRKAAWTKLRALRVKKQQLEQKLTQFRSSEEVSAGKRIQQGIRVHFEEFGKAWIKAARREQERADQDKRNQAADALEDSLEAAQALLTALEGEKSISPRLGDALQEIIQGVAKRFSLADGMLPLKVESGLDTQSSGDPGERGRKERKTHQLKTADNREMVHFSTGQKAQMGISLLVAQNLYLSHFLPHRIILLDDLTTAYDLTNLTREAILWRQLAYGRQPDDPLARQVFISTHHEDLTNKLLELLVPPAGRSMRVVHFKGYDRKTGPEIEVFEVEPTAASDAAREALAAELQHFHL